MKVEITEEVTVTAEVEVDLDTVIGEWFRRLSEHDQGGVRRTIGTMLDSVTRLMARLSDESIEALPDTARAEMRKRLETELARYQER